MEVPKPQSAALPGKVNGQEGHAARDVSAAAHDGSFGHGVRALKGNNHGELLAGGAAAWFSEVAVEHGAFEINLHALEGSARDLGVPSLVKHQAGLLVGGKHARFGDRLRPSRLAIEVRGARVILVGGDIEPLRGELFCRLLVAFRDARMFDDPGFEVVGLQALSDFERLRVAGVDGGSKAKLELPASWQSLAREKVSLGSAADNS